MGHCYYEGDKFYPCEDLDEYKEVQRYIIRDRKRRCLVESGVMFKEGHQFEHRLFAACPFCGERILPSWVTDKRPDSRDIEIARLKERIATLESLIAMGGPWRIPKGADPIGGVFIYAAPDVRIEP